MNQLSNCLRLHTYKPLSCSSESQEKVLFFVYGYNNKFFLLLYNRISIYPHLLRVYLLHIQHLLVPHSKTLLMQMWFHYKPHIINSYSIHCKFVRNVMNTTISTMKSDNFSWILEKHTYCIFLQPNTNWSSGECMAATYHPLKKTVFWDVNSCRPIHI